MATIDAPKKGFGRTLIDRYSLRKDPHRIVEESRDPKKSLKKTLGAYDLTVLGVGAIIGAGIFVLAGIGATKAGPFIVLSFVLAGLICALAGLSYAELASTIPTSGSAYAYTYSSMGETTAWVLAWALVLEYAVGSAAVAIAWSGNLRALMATAGLVIPEWASFGIASGVDGGFINLPAFLLVLGLTTMLVMGSKNSAKFAGVLVLIKVAILLFIVAFGSYLLTTDIGFANWRLPLPPADTSQWYGILGPVGGVIGAAAIIFFAYIGFDAVSTTAEEAKNPKRDLPIGILGSLAICTLLYILAAGVLVGMVPYTDFDAASVGAGVAAARLEEPFGYAFEAAGVTWAATLVRVGAVVGLGSVLLVLLLGGPRVFFALARDGLLPESLSKVHEKFGTPYKTTIAVGLFVALMAGFGTVGLLAEVANIGTLFAFTLVCAGVVVLRYRNPDLERPFKVPLNIGRFPILAALGAVLCVGLMASLSRVTQIGFFAWMGAGLIIYALYGIHNSVLFREGRTIVPAAAGGPEAVGGVYGDATKPRDAKYDDVEIVLEEYKSR